MVFEENLDPIVVQFGFKFEPTWALFRSDTP